MALGIRKLLEDLSHADLEVKLLALNTLSRFPFKRDSKSSQAELKSLLAKLQNLENHPQPDLRNLAKKALDHLNDEFKPPPEQEISAPPKPYDPSDLKSSDPNIRRSMLKIMQKQKPKTAYSDLLELLIWERNDSVLEVILQVMSDVGTENTVDFLEIYLLSPNTNLRAQAVKTIATLGDRKAILERLTPCIEDSTDEVRINAIKALSDIPVRQALLEFKTWITSPQTSTRISGLKIVSIFTDDEVVDLVNILASDHSENIRLQTVDSLALTGNKKAIPILRRLSQDMNIQVSEKALSTLDMFSEKNRAPGLKLKEVFGGQNTILDDPPNDLGSPSVHLPTEPAAEDLSQVDEKIEKAMLNLGKALQIRCSGGVIREDRYSTEIHKIKKVEGRLNEAKAKHKKSGLISSFSRYMGSRVEEEIALRHLEILLDESWIELGETFWQFYQNEGLTHGLEPLLSRIEKLLHQRSGKRL
jgi:HEAT repeat protein